MNCPSNWNVNNTVRPPVYLRTTFIRLSIVAKYWLANWTLFTTPHYTYSCFHCASFFKSPLERSSLSITTWIMLYTYLITTGGYIVLYTVIVCPPVDDDALTGGRIIIRTANIFCSSKLDYYAVYRILSRRKLWTADEWMTCHEWPMLQISSWLSTWQCVFVCDQQSQSVWQTVTVEVAPLRPPKPECVFAWTALFCRICSIGTSINKFFRQVYAMFCGTGS